MEKDPVSHIEPVPAIRFTGEEKFRPTDLRLIDFWRWAFSDLRANIVRGVLAEYLVGQAIGDPSKVRGSWGNYDLDSKSGIRIEVKSSAYLQSWRQRTLSKIVFSGLTARGWDDLTGEFTLEREVRADVFVFAIQTADKSDQYDMLDVGQWIFHVVPARAVNMVRAP
jgi:hypothetical protein